jgi:hypothetical protein
MITDRELKNSAVILIQCIWKKFKLKNIYNDIKYLFSIGLTIENIKSIDIATLIILLKKKSVILKSKNCLEKIYKLCISRHSFLITDSTPKNINIKEFLAGYMIAYYSNDVLDNMGTLEQALFDATVPLITTFENICRVIYSSDNHSLNDVPLELTKDFPAMLFKYLECFKAWKIVDQQSLVIKIKETLKLLHRAKERLPKDSEDIIEINIKIETLNKNLSKFENS